MKIYVGFKATQLENTVLRRSGAEEEARWDRHHQWAAEKMYRLCVDMRGFFLKVGQFFGVRDDFFPPVYLAYLSTLQDRVPPMSARETRRRIEEELGGKTLEDVFTEIDLDHPLGSGTIAQVHSAVCKSDRQRVAVKIQYDDAGKKMHRDLKRLRVLCAFLQRTELKFDIVSAIDEMSNELMKEFDFYREATALEAIAANLQRRRVRKVEIPRPIRSLSTSKMLVMSFVPGTPMSQLGDKLGTLTPKRRNYVCRYLLDKIADVYGGMILLDGLFQADPHPGNIFLNDDLSIGIVDFGQWKALSPSRRSKLAQLYDQMERQSPQGIVTAMTNLGIETKPIAGFISPPPSTTSRRQRSRHPSPPLSPSPQEQLAHTMFDTRTIPGTADNPFDPDSPIKKVSIETFPKDIYFVLRTVQILRGIAHGMNQPTFSLCSRWNKDAKRVLKSTPTPHLPAK